MRAGALILGLFMVAASAAAASESERPAPATASGSATIEELFARVQTLQSEAKWTAAVDTYRQILSREPTNESALFGLGTVYIQLDDFKQAAPLLEQVRRKMPDHPSVLNNLAWIYARSGDPALRDPATALRYARQAVVTTPSDLNFLNTLAEAYFAGGDFSRAARLARQIVHMAKANGDLDPKAARELLARCRQAGAIVPGEDESAIGRERQDDQP